MRAFSYRTCVSNATAVLFQFGRMCVAVRFFFCTILCVRMYCSIGRIFGEKTEHCIKREKHAQNEMKRNRTQNSNSTHTMLFGTVCDRGENWNECMVFLGDFSIRFIFFFVLSYDFVGAEIEKKVEICIHWILSSHDLYAMVKRWSGFGCAIHLFMLVFMDPNRYVISFVNSLLRFVSLEIWL